MSVRDGQKINLYNLEPGYGLLAVVGPKARKSICAHNFEAHLWIISKAVHTKLIIWLTKTP